MDKLTMAHEFAMKMIEQGYLKTTSRDFIASSAWEYADAMQAEADKRLNVSNAEPLDFIDRIFTPRHSAILAKADKRTAKPNVGNADVSAWQLDWSQAPDGFDWFVKQADDSTHFLKTKPDLCQDYWRTDTCAEWIDADILCPLGWQNSLHKRPNNSLEQ